MKSEGLFSSKLKEIVSGLPDLPGIYQYFNSEGKIIYVGKAKNLKKRVSSYFSKVHDNRKTAILVRKIADIKHMVVDSEGKIIYVGKAKNLKKRVSSYFSKVHDNRKTAILVRKIADIKHMVVDSE